MPRNFREVWKILFKKWVVARLEGNPDGQAKEFLFYFYRLLRKDAGAFDVTIVHKMG